MPDISANARATIAADERDRPPARDAGWPGWAASTRRTAQRHHDRARRRSPSVGSGSKVQPNSRFAGVGRLGRCRRRGPRPGRRRASQADGDGAASRRCGRRDRAMRIGRIVARTGAASRATGADARDAPGIMAAVRPRAAHARPTPHRRGAPGPAPAAPVEDTGCRAPQARAPPAKGWSFLGGARAPPIVVVAALYVTGAGARIVESLYPPVAVTEQGAHDPRALQHRLPDRGRDLLPRRRPDRLDGHRATGASRPTPTSRPRPTATTSPRSSGPSSRRSSSRSCS